MESRKSYLLFWVKSILGAILAALIVVLMACNSKPHVFNTEDSIYKPGEPVAVTLDTMVYIQDIHYDTVIVFQPNGN